MNEFSVSHHHHVRRPTEEIAFANIAREASRLGISQVDIIRRDAFYVLRHIMKHPTVCHCMYCKRKRALQNNEN